MFLFTTNFPQQQQPPLKKFTFGAFSWNGEDLNSPQYLFGNHTAEDGPISNSIEHYLGFNRKMAKMIFPQKDDWINPLSYQYITNSNFSALTKFNELQLINYESDPVIAKRYEERLASGDTILIGAVKIRKFDWANFFTGFYQTPGK